MDIDWVDLPFEGCGLDELRHIGNGKDADLELRLSDGRRFALGVGELRVTADAALTVLTRRHGDLALDIRYGGPDLVIRRTRMGYRTYSQKNEEFFNEFRQDVEEFLRADGEGELLYVVDVEVELTAGPPQEADAD